MLKIYSAPSRNLQVLATALSNASKQEYSWWPSKYLWGSTETHSRAITGGQQKPSWRSPEIKFQWKQDGQVATKVKVQNKPARTLWRTVIFEATLRSDTVKYLPCSSHLCSAMSLSSRLCKCH
jgi:hypothetical protein